MHPQVPASARRRNFARAPAGSAFAASSFDVTEIDKSINPCDDFNGFVNAKWVAKNPIPADRTRWGAFDQLREHSLETQHEIAEKASKDADNTKAGSIEQKIGWFYRSGMDDAAVEKAGYDPIKADLRRIDATEIAGRHRRVVDRQRPRADAPMCSRSRRCRTSRTPRRRSHTRSRAALRLPTRDYYEKPDYAELRDAYKAHLAKVLQLAGVAEADAKKQAEQVLAFETRLAKASFLPVELRDPENQYHFVTIAEADKVTPNISSGRSSSPRSTPTSRRASRCRNRSSSPKSMRC